MLIAFIIAIVIVSVIMGIIWLEMSITLNDHNHNFLAIICSIFGSLCLLFASFAVSYIISLIASSM